MNRKTILWTAVAFIAGGMVAARNNIMEHQGPPPKAHAVKVFLIAPQDKSVGGKQASCGDATVAITQQIPAGADPVQDAFNALFAIKQEHYGAGGLYNALYQSDLKIAAVNVNKKGDVLTVKLTGELILHGACGNSQIRAQLEQTAKTASKAGKVSLFINNKPLDTVLSSQ